MRFAANVRPDPMLRRVGWPVGPRRAISNVFDISRVGSERRACFSPFKSLNATESRPNYVATTCVYIPRSILPSRIHICVAFIMILPRRTSPWYY